MGTLQDYRSRPHWSYSSLNQLLNICSLQWAFEKLEKRPRPFRPLSLVMGSAFHRVMEYIALNRMQGSKPSDSDVRDLFHEIWSRECDEGEPVQFGNDKLDKNGCSEQGMSLCSAFLDHVDDEEEVLRFNEAFAVPVAGGEKPLVGELDCIVRNSDGDVTVVDWKTAARRWPKGQADKSPQPTAYLYAYDKLHPDEPVDFRFDVVVKNKTPVVEKHGTERGEEDYARFEALVQTAESIVQSELFYPADTSFFCAGCPFTDACKSWHKEAARRYSFAA